MHGTKPSYMVVTSITMKKNQGWASILTNEDLVNVKQLRQDQNVKKRDFMQGGISQIL